MVRSDRTLCVAAVLLLALAATPIHAKLADNVVSQCECVVEADVCLLLCGQRCFLGWNLSGDGTLPRG